MSGALNQTRPAAAGRGRLTRRAVERQQASQHALARPPGPRGTRSHGVMRMARRANTGLHLLTCLTTTYEEQVVGSHTGRPAAPSPHPSARRNRTDEELPGDVTRAQPVDPAVLAHGQDAGAISPVRSRPQPARLGALHVPPEALGQGDASPRSTGRA